LYQRAGLHILYVYLVGNDLTINALYDIAREGTQSEEEELFKVLSARFRLFARQRIWDALDSEEIVQDALMTICKEYKEIDFTTSFSAWAYKVLDNRILGYIQTKKRREGKVSLVSEADNLPAAEKDNPKQELKRKIVRCMRKVADTNQRYARVLNLHYQGFSTEEICDKMHLTRNNLYSVLSRARSMLEYCLERGEIK